MVYAIPGLRAIMEQQRPGTTPGQTRKRSHAQQNKGMQFEGARGPVANVETMRLTRAFFSLSTIT